MIGWVITKDNLCEDGEPSRVGTRAKEQSTIPTMQRIMGFPIAELAEGTPIAFRLRDEDNEIHYEGVMGDDPECLNQLDASRFGELDTGAFICEVWRDGKWVMEVG